MRGSLLAPAVVLLLALPAAGAATDEAGSEGGAPWVVVQTDGARVNFARPPERRGARLVGRLRAGGALVSIPTARVDEEATRRANAKGAVAPVPGPAPARRPAPFETPPLGDRVQLRTSGAEAGAHIEGARKGTPAPAREPAGAGLATDAPPPAAPEPTDRLGRGEAYWRERAAELRAALEEAAAERAAAEAMLEAAERAWLGGSEAERTTFVLNVLAARERAERARLEHRRAEGRWEALGEEARKAGAFPGWLR